MLDTFHDHAHGLFFYVNPLGVQQDGIWDEASLNVSGAGLFLRHGVELRGQAYRGQDTWRGSRFHSSHCVFLPTDVQNWGVFFERDIKRNSEDSFYPHITSNAQGFLVQGAEMDGIEKVAPSRNMQFIPYVVGTGIPPVR